MDLFLNSNRLSCEKNWSSRPSTSGSYSKLAGRLADKLQMDFEIFKILYRWSLTLLTSVQCYQQCQKCISVCFSQTKHILGCVLQDLKFCHHFLCRSLLLGTSVPNDKKGGGLAFHIPYAYCFRKRMGHLVCVHLYE